MNPQQATKQRVTKEQQPYPTSMSAVPAAEIPSTSTEGATGVASAPKKASLYQSLLQYHQEQDSDDDSSRGDPRRNRKGVYGIRDERSVERKPPPIYSSSFDRKLPARPTNNLKQPPSQPANETMDPSPSLRQPRNPPHLDRPESASSFYKSALEASYQHPATSDPSRQMSDPAVGSTKPGIVMVNEPAVRPDSVMYRMAYGDLRGQYNAKSTSSLDSSEQRRSSATRASMQAKPPVPISNRPSGMDTRVPPPRNRSSGSLPGLQPTRSRSGAGLSSSNHSERHLNLFADPGSDEHIRQSYQGTRHSSGEVKVAPSPSNSNNRAAAPTRNSSSENGSSRPFGMDRRPQHPASNQSYQTPQYTMKKPPPVTQVRSHGSTLPQPTPPNDLRTRRPMSSYSQQSQVLSAPSRPRQPHQYDQPMGMTPKSYPPLSIEISNTKRNYASGSSAEQHTMTPSRNKSNPNMFFPPPTVLHHRRSSSTGDISAADEELRLALEISRREAMASAPGGVFPPPPTMTAATARTNTTSSSKPLPTWPVAVTSRNYPAPSHHRPRQTSFGRSALDRADDLEHNSLNDVLLALQLSAEESSSGGRGGGRSLLAPHGRRSTNLDELLAWEMQNNSAGSSLTLNGRNGQSANEQSVTDFVAAGISADSSTSHMSSANAEQLRILEQIREEREQKELELALKASEEETAGAHTMQTPPEDFLASQQKAMQEFASRGRYASTDSGAGLARTPSLDSANRRRELLKRGTQETRDAISAGEAHIVTCRGCGGRLQAPVSYSLVFCPKCQTISPT